MLLTQMAWEEATQRKTQQSSALLELYKSRIGKVGGCGCVWALCGGVCL